ncbi:MAG: acid phosphatase AphA [Rickettsiaceae bacterium H1]|nr:acid phosphatase AphA [Rickettsiaceae bacterium H1]
MDDTVLFSSPGFYYHTKRLCKGNILICIGRNDFWESVNNSDQYSLPKKIGFQLIKMHQERGDNIYFITARSNPSKAKNDLKDLLKKTFEIKKMNEVIFTGILEDKIKPIKENDIKIYYGDSDSDMRDAIAAGVRPIRVMRANSINHLPFTLGAFNEEVLSNSEA